MQFEIFYDPKFDLPNTPKLPNQQTPAVTSLQAHLKQISFPAEARVLNITHDNVPESESPLCDVLIALDLLEHVANPDTVAEKLFNSLRSGGTLYTSTPNIAFLPLRLMLLVGWFNYSRRGILDVTHRRLFTVSAFCRLLRDKGFHLESVKGFGPPIAALPAGKSGWLRLLDQAWSRAAYWWPTLFAYQILVQAKRTESADDLMKQIFPLSLTPLAIEQEAEKTTATIGFR